MSESQESEETPVDQAAESEVVPHPLTYAENPPHKITSYKLIPNDDHGVINTIINKEEGGWVVTSHHNDNDGGWTYAGITSSVFTKYCPYVTLDTIDHRANYPTLPQVVVEIYYAEYYQPVMEATKFHKEVPQYLRPMVYSCAVNCGPGEAALFFQGADKIYVLSQQGKEFLRLWAQHYVDICKKEPSQLEWLGGWINRVFNYVTG